MNWVEGNANRGDCLDINVSQYWRTIKFMYNQSELLYVLSNKCVIGT